MSVTFGKRERFKFMAGGTVDHWQSGQGPAIYALTYKQDVARRPKAHTVIFFGEAADLSQPSIRAELMKWREDNCGHIDELFLFFHPMPGSSEQDRSRIKHQLVLEYQPHGND